MEFRKEQNALIARRQGETLRIEGWGKDSLRVRAWMYEAGKMNDWALTEEPEKTDCTVTIGNENEIKQRIGFSTGAVNYYPKKKLKELARICRDSNDETHFAKLFEAIDNL